MIRLSTRLRRFARCEDGSMVIPFALWAPLFMVLMISAVELGLVTIRHSELERALDLTVRDVRLGTGTDWDHKTLKESICANSNLLPNCAKTLNLEMLRLDMRNFNEPDYYPDCADIAADTQTQRNFESGGSNDVIFLRACYKYQPFSPSGYLSSYMMVDRNGFTALISSSAFVLEPE
ncbi:TadE/TadG family type IV pilus assembly protein [Pseudoprimorskyibacter insulae]|uniref:TadE-like domain-containing protein n=1 Tax=Pseudoprimorskyibacter insulae TaxID=1695997 RepID=A0A2R8AQZ8_9RHOB|nr:TadE family protein [Pseudoprimorskyibacter insulae]SPF78269.1 hypothetical protein PRI8871_00864 [Pseudoprimorskyibacter insulae]